ncbi:MAG: DUF4405 domain-containing protein [Oscillospiraceae bacterium]|nr:DUF4405 domain-containing protein [Oscillospiraceae bacterium]
MAVDCGMMILLPLLMAYSPLGEAVHEWLGIAITALLVIHHALNRNWYRTLFRGRYSGIRVLGTVTNMLLLADMIALPVSGILMSRHVFVFLDVKAGMSFARTVHLLASHWGLILMSFHIGVHGGARSKAAARKEASAVRTVIPRIAIALLGFWGVFAFIRQEIGSYLFLRNQFVFYDFSRPLVYFLADVIAVMVLFSMAGYYTAKGLKHRSS